MKMVRLVSSFCFLLRYERRKYFEVCRYMAVGRKRREFFLIENGIGRLKSRVLSYLRNE